MIDYNNLDNLNEVKKLLSFVNSCVEEMIRALLHSNLKPEEALCLISSHCIAAIMIMHEDLESQKKFAKKCVEVASELAREVKRMQE